jgi:hypothetical protein
MAMTPPMQQPDNTDARGVRRPHQLRRRGHMHQRGMPGEARLSALQQRILLQLGAIVSSIKTNGTAEAKTALDTWGVLWRPGAGDAHWTPTKRSSCSRSLRRLERRGLVLRRNWRTPHGRRTTHLIPLPKGEAVVQRLAVQARHGVNHTFRQLELRRRALVRRRRRKPSLN